MRARFLLVHKAIKPAGRFAAWMPHRPKTAESPEELRSNELKRELEKLGKETETDALLEALEHELREWEPEEDAEKQGEDTIDRLNRQLIARSVFRELQQTGYHEEVRNPRPMEVEVRRNLAELKKLIEEGKPPRRR